MKGIINGCLLGALLWALILIPVFAGPYVEVGLGKHGLKQDWWIGRDKVGGHFGIGYLWRGDVFDVDLGWKHASQPGLGVPVNGYQESTNDSILLIIRYEWR